MIYKELPVFKERKMINLEDSFNLLDHIKEEISGPSPNLSKEKWIYDLIERLVVFTDKRKTFFSKFHTTRTNAEQVSLQESPDYPPHYVLKVILDQFSIDFSVIQRAYNQRRSEQADTLLKADYLAKKALSYAEGEGKLIQITQPITYFQKSASVRVVPYANIALIGIPYTCITNPNDYLSIAHEVGHHVYWHGEIEKTPIPNYLANHFNAFPKWLLDWLEEIFADIYGVLVAGPAIALSFQDLLLQRSTTELFSFDDGSHPISWLRPYVYTYALKEIYSINDKTNEHLFAGLERYWNYQATKQGGKTEYFHPFSEQQKVKLRWLEPVKISEAKVLLESAVNQIIDDIFRPIFQTLIPIDIWSRAPINLSRPPEAKRNESEKEEAMIELKQGVFESTGTLKEPGLDHLYDIFKQWLEDDWLENHAAFKRKAISISRVDDSWGNKLIDFINSSNDQAGISVPPEFWLPIFAAGGWTIKGPDTEPVIG